MKHRLSTRLWTPILLSGALFASSGLLLAAETAPAVNEVPSETNLETYQGKIVVLPVDDKTFIVKAAFEFMQKTIRRAELEEASAIVLEMDTPGGRIDYTKDLVFGTLQNVTIPTYTFVNPEATSAGAILALGTKTIYMRPASTIGSALAVTAMGDIEGDMKSKIDQSQIAFMRNIAEINGHNPDIAEAFVTRTKAVRIGGKQIHKAGEVLNLNAISATEIIDGAPVLAKGIANSIEEIVTAEELEGEIIRPEPQGLEAFAFWVQTVSVILIGIGVAGAWLELKMPGFGLPGFVSVIAFGIFLFGNYMAGNLAGYEAAVAIVLGLLLLALEIFVVPGTLVAGALGMCLILGGVIMAMVDRVDMDWFRRGGEIEFGLGDLLSDAIWTTSLAMVAALIITAVLLRILPNSRIGSPLILKTAVPGGASLEGDFASDDAEASLVGHVGKATTDLRPAGKALVDGQYLDVTADGEWIEKDNEVKIVIHEGSRIVVRRP